MKYKAMISYAVELEDKLLANYIYEYLTGKNLKVWYSAEALKSNIGTPITEAIIDAMLNSEYAICIVSEKYLEPRWSSLELNTLIDLMTKNKIKIIPVLCNLSVNELRDLFPLLTPYMLVDGEDYEEIALKVYEGIVGNKYNNQYSNLKDKKIKDRKRIRPKNSIMDSNVDVNGDLHIGDIINQNIENKGNINRNVNIERNDGTINL